MLCSVVSEKIFIGFRFSIIFYVKTYIIMIVNEVKLLIMTLFKLLVIQYLAF